MQELNCSPNLHAQSLAGGRSRTIGVIVSNIENRSSSTSTRRSRRVPTPPVMSS
jgi:DNA-binding LacI/PurR family transcriptional regulator